MKLHSEIINILNENNYPIVRKEVSLDFELAAITAVRKVHGTNAIVRNCFFHLTQNFYNYIVDMGFKVRYTKDREFSKQVKMYMALAFLPPADIVPAFDELELYAHADLKPFVKYVSEWYIKGVNGHGPRYPPTLWSTYREDGMLAPKTQNYIESFHAKIGRVLQAKHVGVFRFMSELQKETSEQQTEILQTLNGVERQGQKGCYSERNRRIAAIIENEANYPTYTKMLEHLSTCIGEELLTRM